MNKTEIKKRRRVWQESLCEIMSRIGQRMLSALSSEGATQTATKTTNEIAKRIKSEIF